MSCRTLGLFAHLFPCRTALFLHSTLQTGPFPACRYKDLCLAVLPNRARSQVISPTEVTTMLLPSRKTSIGSTYSSGEDTFTTPAVSEVDERSNLGMLASPLLTQERESEREVQPRSEFITLTEKVLRDVHHTFLPVRGDPWRCSHTRENQVEIQRSCRSLIQKEKGFSLSIEKSAISLNCEPIMLLKVKKLLYQYSLKQNIKRTCFLRNKRIIYCLKPDPR